MISMGGTFLEPLKSDREVPDYQLYISVFRVRSEDMSSVAPPSVFHFVDLSGSCAPELLTATLWLFPWVRRDTEILPAVL